MNYLPPKHPAAAPIPPSLRYRIEAAVEQLLAVLDALDEPDTDREDSLDRECDEAESGAGDLDGLIEQTVGEPSLGATLDVDQRAAWFVPDGLLLVDGEASEDDVAAGAFRDSPVAETDVRERIRTIRRRRGLTGHREARI